MGGPRLVVDHSVRRHTPRSRKFPDKLQELTLRSPNDARDIEKLVDFALLRLDGIPSLPRRRRA